MARLASFIESLRYDAEYEQMVEGRSVVSAYFVVGRSLVAYLARRLVCRLREHDLADVGYCTPEHGCIDIVCQRCGWSAGRTWLF